MSGVDQTDTGAEASSTPHPWPADRMADGYDRSCVRLIHGGTVMTIADLTCMTGVYMR